MHTTSVSGALDNLGNIRTGKSDINQPVGAARLALSCPGLHVVMVEGEAGNELTSLHSRFLLSAMKHVRNTDVKFPAETSGKERRTDAYAATLRGE